MSQMPGTRWSKAVSKSGSTLEAQERGLPVASPGIGMWKASNTRRGLATCQHPPDVHLSGTRSGQWLKTP